MGLDLEYFKNQTHISDLQKLNKKNYILLFVCWRMNWKNLILMMVLKQKA